MQYLNNRISSFDEITKPKPKIKPSFPLTATTHPNLTPDSLASAGFYHTPGSSSSSLDNCKCFMCDLELGGWDENDDPYEEHAKRIGCSWADAVCAVKMEKRKRDRSNGKYTTLYLTPDSLPQSTESAMVREQTFKKWWPHKQKSGWLPTVKELARAGFVYIPSTESKDAVFCPYCEYSVEGWEATDDPWQIHSSKVPDCHFFRSSLMEQAPTDEKTSKASGRSARSQTVKKSKRATTAATTIGSDLEVETQSVDEEQDDEPPASQATTSGRRAAKPRATTTTKAKGGSRKKAATVDPDPEPELEVEPQSEAASEIEAEMEEEEAETKPRKGRSKAKTTKAKPRGTTAKGKGKKKVEVESEDLIEEEPVPSQPVESEVDEEEVEKTPAPAPQSKTRSTKVPSKALPPIPPTSPSPAPVSSPGFNSSRPLSQLDRFANIPPSSPIPSPRPKSTLRTTQARSVNTNTSSPYQNLPREVLNTSLQRGAIEARKVMEKLMSSPTPAPTASPGITPKQNHPQKEGKEKEEVEFIKLTEEQKEMTLEQLVRSEMRKRFEEMQKEGEDMIGKWEQRARFERKRIDAL